MSLVEQQISPYVPSQLPRIIRAEGPEFVAFCQAYYQWMEQEGGVIAEGRSAFEYRDIDTTLDQFLTHWVKKYMSGVPVSILGNIRVLQKHIKELFSTKGTVQGLKLLFQLLYGQEVTVYYPGKDILKASDGTWVRPSYVEITTTENNVLLIGQIVTGRESGATAIVEDYQTRFVNGKQINLLFLSNIRGLFNTGEILLNSITSNALACPVIIGSMTNIDVNESGFGYKVGDVLEVVGGNGISGKAVVSKVSPRSGTVTFSIIDGGSGYANNNPYAPTTVDITPVDPGNPGVGAAFKIGKLSNTSIITTAVDVIDPYANVALDAYDYGFPNGESVAGTYAVSNVVFATGDGTSNTFYLKNAAGSNVTGANVSAIYQNNWEGRLLLYPTARTNLCTRSNMNPWATNGPVTASSAQADPAGGTDAILISSPGGSGLYGIYRSNMFTANVGDVLTYSVFCKHSSGTPSLRMTLEGGGLSAQARATFDPSTGTLSSAAAIVSNTSITDIGNGWFRFSLTTTVDVGGNISATLYAGTADASAHFLYASQIEAGTQVTSYIPTSATASNTVTDYVAFANGEVDTAVPPVSGATLDWTGTFTENGANYNTPIGQALNVQDITVGSIASLTAINPGVGYNGPISIHVHNDVIAGLRLDDGIGGIQGDNADIQGAATAGQGAIDQVQVLDSGYGYLDGDVISLSSANNDTIAGGVVHLGHAGHSQGYWSDTRSFLNSDKYIEDGHYYQDYSYEVQASISYDRYSNLLKNFWHPAGTLGFGKVVIFKEDDSGSSIADLQIQTVFETTFLHEFSYAVATSFATSTVYNTKSPTAYITQAATVTSRGTQTQILNSLPEQLVNGTFYIDLSNWTTLSGNVMWNATRTMSLGNTTSSGQAYQGFAANSGSDYWLSLDVTQYGGGNVTMYVANTADTAAAIASNTSSNATHITLHFVANSPTMFVILEGTAGAVLVDNVSVKELPEATQDTALGTSRNTTTAYGTNFATSRTTTTAFNTAFVTAYNTQAFTASLFATSRQTQTQTASVFDTAFNTVRATNVATDTVFDTGLPTSFSTSTGYTTVFDTAFGTSRSTGTSASTSYATSLATDTAYNTVYDTNFSTSLVTTTQTVFNTNNATTRSTATTFNTIYDTVFNTNKPTAYATDTQLSTSRTSTYVTNFVTSYTTTFATTFGTTIVTTFNTAVARATATTRTTSFATDTSFLTTFGTSAITNRSTAVATSASTAYATGTSASTSRTTTFVTTFVSSYNSSRTTAFATSRSTSFNVGASRATQTFQSTSRATGTSATTTSETFCVAADMFLSDGVMAKDVKPGMEFITWTPSEGFKSNVVEAVGQPIMQHTIKLITKSGAMLYTSSSTPFNLKTAKHDLEEGHWKLAPDMLGEEVIVVHGTDAPVWEEIVELIHVGDRLVVPISFGGRSFAAGCDANARIFSHNMTKTVRDTVYVVSFNTTTSFFTYYNTTTTYNSVASRTTTFDTLVATSVPASVSTSASTSRTTNYVTAFNTNTTIVTNYISTYLTSFTTTFDTSATTAYSTTTSLVTTFNTTTNYLSSASRSTTFDTSQLTSAATSAATSASTSLVTTYMTAFATDTTIATASPTAFQTVRSTAPLTTTAYTTTFATNFGTATTTVYDTLFSTARATVRSTATTFDTTIATIKPTSTAFDTAFSTNFETSKATDTIFNTMVATNFSTITGFNTTYTTVGSTQRLTASTFSTTYNTSTNKLTTLATSRDTVIATNFATTTAYDTLFDTNTTTATSYNTVITTQFIVVPTTFQTSYNTLTDVATTYLTNVLTTAATDTTIDTEYPTSRITSIATGTSLLPPQ